MPVTYQTFDAKERKTKGGGVRPGYSYQGVVRDSVRTDSAENFLSDLLELSDGDLSKVADFAVEGFNSLAEKAANPTKDEAVKAVLATMKAAGVAPNVAKAIEIARRLKAEVSA